MEFAILVFFNDPVFLSFESPFSPLHFSVAIFLGQDSICLGRLINMDLEYLLESSRNSICFRQIANTYIIIIIIHHSLSSFPVNDDVRHGLVSRQSCEDTALDGEERLRDG